MKVIGLTGTIGAGKSEAAKILRRWGAFVIDADKIAHTLYKPQSPVWRQVVTAFGAGILNRGGVINRRKLGETVFSDRRKLSRLNRIVHPYLKKAILDETEKLKNLKTEKLVVINAAVLKEMGLVDYVDVVWVVLASRQKRLRRLVRGGLTRQEALRRIKAQATQKEYLALADVVIRNEGTLKQLQAKVQACFNTGSLAPLFAGGGASAWQQKFDRWFLRKTWDSNKQG